MADTITINDIHTDTLKVDLTLNINGVDYADTLPILKLDDAATLTQQLQAFAQETRGEFQALTAAIQASEANQPPTVDPSVTALVGQAIPVDVTSTTPPATDGTTTPPATDGGDTTAPATDGSTPTDAGSVAPGEEQTPATPAGDTTSTDTTTTQ